MKKLWYAVMMDDDDNDWGDGSFDREESEKRVRDYRANGMPDAYIAVIDANYNEAGEATTGGECVEEIREI